MAAMYTGNDTTLTDHIFGTQDTIISDSDDAEFLSASEAVKKLEESWLNEMLCPELLSPQTELVDCLLEQTKNMKDNLMSVSKSDFRFAIHRMEVCNIMDHYLVCMKTINFCLLLNSLNRLKDFNTSLHHT